MFDCETNISIQITYSYFSVEYSIMESTSNFIEWWDEI